MPFCKKIIKVALHFVLFEELGKDSTGMWIQWTLFNMDTMGTVLKENSTHTYVVVLKP